MQLSAFISVLMSKKQVLLASGRPSKKEIARPGETNLGETWTKVVTRPELELGGETL